MDNKAAERVVIAKPVASRPTCSSFKSFSDILASAFTTSPPHTASESMVAAIRPKTVRFKLKDNPDPPPRAKVSGTAAPGTTARSSSDNVSISDGKSTVLFKPLAKHVSKRTISQLSLIGNINVQNHLPLLSVEDCIQSPNQYKDNVESAQNSNLPRNMESTFENSQSIESSRATLNYSKETSGRPKISSIQPSYDGYNWRKYGQKQVKGSEFPRSYYKCTHPNCPVKKKVERSLDGKIAEIVYKGEHNHPKPQPLKHNSSGTQGEGSTSNGTARDTHDISHLLPLSNSRSQLCTNSELLFNYLNGQIEGGCESRLENPCEKTCLGRVAQPFDPVASRETNAEYGVSDYSCGVSVECEEGSKGLEPIADKLQSKRRGGKNYIDGVKEPHATAQGSTDIEVLGKGVRWRKYGQKVVKGNVYPRSYYRCTGLECKARKYVERASDGPDSFITTYEGKHNHGISLGNADPIAPGIE